MAVRRRAAAKAADPEGDLDSATELKARKRKKKDSSKQDKRAEEEKASGGGGRRDRGAAKKQGVESESAAVPKGTISKGNSSPVRGGKRAKLFDGESELEASDIANTSASTVRTLLQTPTKSLGDRPAGFLSPGLSFLSPSMSLWNKGEDSMSSPQSARRPASPASGPAEAGRAALSMSESMMQGGKSMAGAGLRLVNDMITPVATFVSLPPVPNPSGIRFTDYMLGEASSRFDPWKDRMQQPTENLPGNTDGQHIPPFMRVPLKLELTLTVGFLACFDSFLFNFTLLPLRCLTEIWSIASNFFRGRKALDSFPEDIARMTLMVLAFVALNNVDISYLYHYIRGQMSSYIKLYVIYNVLEVFDRLFCSLGQDVFDGMIRLSQQQSSEHGEGDGGMRLHDRDITGSLFYIPLSIGYVIGHSTVLLIQVVVLNVAINSNNNALITLLVANNFTELKSHVFKKLEEASLLQVVCADIVERFQLVIFLSLVTVQNVSKDGYNLNKAWLQDWGNMVVIVWCTEYVVDWIKHAFVTKFNKIDPSVYNRYRSVIWEHFCDAWKLRQPHRVAKHVGFVSLPIACVTLRVVIHAIPPELVFKLRAHMTTVLPLIIIWWLLLCLIKTLLYLSLLGHACKKHKAMVGQPASPSSTKGSNEDSQESIAQNVSTYPQVQSLMGVQMFHRTYKKANESTFGGGEPPSPPNQSQWSTMMGPSSGHLMSHELSGLDPLPAPAMSGSARKRQGAGVTHSLRLAASPGTS